MNSKIFVHTNPKQIIGAKIAKYTMEKNSANSQDFSVEFINTADNPFLLAKHGKPYLREGKKVIWDKEDLQSFTLLRFLPPQLMGFKGRAVVTDPDVFSLKDIYPLLTMDLQGKAIAARRIRPKDGRPKYWASSVMLLDCEKLKHWQWEKMVDDLFTFKKDYRDLMSLLLEDQKSILAIPDEWNHYDQLNDQTRLLHNTGRLTQPWKTGLPIDFSMDKVKPPRKWGRRPKTWLKNIKEIARPYIKPETVKAPKRPTHYRVHPDKNQERFFFKNVIECLDKGIINQDELKKEMELNHVRKDAFDVVNYYRSEN
jgi:hypothetical protein